MKTIGVIGLGIIGGIWARHYANAGVLAGTWNRTPQPSAPRWLSLPEDVATASEVVQIVVADPVAVRSVIEKMLPQLGPEKIVVQSSTIDPKSSAEFCAAVEARGARYLEAPFTGSKPGAEAKKTIFYLGGDSALIREVEPVLALVSETRLHIGTHAQAATVKLSMNLNIAAQMQALSEAFFLAQRAGVTADVFFRALSINASYSGVTRLKEPMLRTGDFSPQFSVKHMAKDLRLASLQSSSDHLPVLRAVRESLQRAEESGYAENDFAALVKLL